MSAWFSLMSKGEKETFAVSSQFLSEKIQNLRIRIDKNIQALRSEKKNLDPLREMMRCFSSFFISSPECPDSTESVSILTQELGEPGGFVVRM